MDVIRLAKEFGLTPEESNAKIALYRSKNTCSLSEARKHVCENYVEKTLIQVVHYIKHLKNTNLEKEEVTK